PDADAINFSIRLIPKHQDLPEITEAVTIDGSTLGFVEYRGTGEGDKNWGLYLDSAIVVRGLAIYGGTGTPIRSFKANNVIEGNLLGIDPSGNSYPQAYGSNGISIEGSGNNNTIGGTTPAARNVISGN